MPGIPEMLAAKMNPPGKMNSVRWLALIWEKSGRVLWLVASHPELVVVCNAHPYPDD